MKKKKRRPVVRPDETIHWEGRPQPGFGVTWQGILWGAVGLPFFLFVHYLIVTMLLVGGDLITAVMVPHTILVYYFCLSAIVYDQLHRRYARYILTQRAAYVVYDSPFSLDVRRYPFSRMSILVLNADTVLFNVPTIQVTRRNVAIHRAPGFYHLEDASFVFHLLTERLNRPFLTDTTQRKSSPLRLLRGEQLRWTGKPDPAAVFRMFDLLVVLPTGIAAVWLVGVGAISIVYAFELRAVLWLAVLVLLFGIYLLFVGCYLLIGRFFHTHLDLKRTTFGLTDVRALIHCRWPGGERLISVQREHITDVLHRNQDTLLFREILGSVVPAENLVMNRGKFGGFAHPGFYTIPDAERVAELLASHDTTAMSDASNSMR